MLKSTQYLLITIIIVVHFGRWINFWQYIPVSIMVYYYLYHLDQKYIDRKRKLKELNKSPGDGL